MTNWFELVDRGVRIHFVRSPRDPKSVIRLTSPLEKSGAASARHRVLERIGD